ncbi:MAG: 16S rRNA (uracil(1498)-N(3))-methyltransferase [Proteobacteria bacterium]|nr:16S rRNA (uracil(1498)-N(3))-methyltransferase [Pseudomonadota bacterium]
MTVDTYKKLVRLYVPESELISGKKCFLSNGQTHYLRNVMRKTAGDALRVFNGHDGEWVAQIEELNKNKILINLDHKIHEQKNSTDIWVLASPIKKESLDLMVQKSCELGAAKFIPLICEHTVVHKINQERLQAISTEAAEQSERLDVMLVEPLTSLRNYSGLNGYDRNLIVCLERTGEASLVKVAQTLSGKPVGILVGPEGGFSSQDIDFIRNLKHVYPVSLGPRILKTETALISALSCIQLIS